MAVTEASLLSSSVASLCGDTRWTSADNDSQGISQYCCFCFYNICFDMELSCNTLEYVIFIL